MTRIRNLGECNILTLRLLNEHPWLTGDRYGEFRQSPMAAACPNQLSSFVAQGGRSRRPGPHLRSLSVLSLFIPCHN
jgi:hypothetical protein